MATRTKLTVAPQKPEQTEQQESLYEQSWLTDDAVNESGLNNALQSVFAEMGLGRDGEATVFVSLLDALGKGEEAQVFRGEPEDYDLWALARQHGTGKYRIKIYVKNQDGQKVLKANKVIGCKLSPEEERQRTHPADTGNYVTKNDLETILDKLVSRLSAPVQQQNPNDTLKLAVEIAKAMQPAQPQVGMVEMMNLSMQFAEKMRAPEQADNVHHEAGANGNDVIIAMTQTFGPAFAAIFQETMRQQTEKNQQAQLPAPQQTTIPEPQQVVRLAQPEPENNQINAEQAGMDQFKQGLAFLVMQATAGNPTATYAELIVDNVPSETLQEILKAPDPVQAMALINPEVAKYQEWFAELLDEIKKMLSDAPIEGEPKIE